MRQTLTDDFWRLHKNKNCVFPLNMVSDLKIPIYNNCDPLTGNIQKTALKAILKYGNHPGTLTTGEVCKSYI